MQPRSSDFLAMLEIKIFVKSPNFEMLVTNSNKASKTPSA